MNMEYQETKELGDYNKRKCENQKKVDCVKNTCKTKIRSDYEQYEKHLLKY